MVGKGKAKIMNAVLCTIVAASVFLLMVAVASASFVPAMTSSTSPAPYIVSASSSYSPYYAAHKAFDADSSSSWTTPYRIRYGWLKVDMGLEGGSPVEYYSITAHDWTTTAPRDFVLEGSDSGAFAGEQVVLDSQSGITDWAAGERKVFAVNGASVYRYYRLNVTVNNGAYYYLRIKELEFFAVEPPYQAPKPQPSAEVSPVLEYQGFYGVSYPYKLAIDEKDNLYVVSPRHGTVYLFDKDGIPMPRLLSVYAPLSIAKAPAGGVYIGSRYSGIYRVGIDDVAIPVVSGDKLGTPMDMAVDSAGYIYVVDGGLVKVFTPSGEYFGPGFGGSTAPARSVTIGPGLDKEGNLVDELVYVGYSVYNTSRQVLVEYLVATYEIGTWEFVRGMGIPPLYWGEPVLPYTIQSADGIAVDADGTVYVAAGIRGRIVIFDKNGNYFHSGLSHPSPGGLLFDSYGRLFISTGGSVRYYTVDGGFELPVIADAGPNQVVEQSSVGGAEVTLDATGSEGDALDYEWTWSGGSASGVNPTVLLSAGDTEVTLTVTSGSRTSDPDKVTVTVQDTIRPSTSVLTSGTPGDNGWYVSSVNVSLLSDDSGSGVKEIHYSVNDGTEQVVAGSTASITIANDGPYSITYWAVDNAGNVEGAGITSGNIDTTDPETTPTYTGGTLGNNGWYISDVSIALDAVDSGSGALEIHYSVNGGTEQIAAGSTASITIASDGPYSITYWAVDNAGNVEGAGSTSGKIDRTAPAITVTTPAAGDYLISEVLTIGFSAVETGSGIFYTSAALDGQAVTNGQAITLYTLAPGSHTLTVSSEDNAGNQSSKSVVFNIIVTADSLSDLIDILLASGEIDNGGVANSLTQQLENGNIDALLNHIDAQDGKHISDYAAELLRTAIAFLN